MSYMSQVQFEFDKHGGPYLKDNMSLYEFNPFLNNIFKQQSY
jgi:hypothetical protein